MAAPSATEHLKVQLPSMVSHQESGQREQSEGGESQSQCSSALK